METKNNSFKINFNFSLGLEKRDFVFLAICVALVFLIYGRSLAGDFVFDDRNIVERQVLLSSFDNLGQILMSPFWSVESGLYRPITLVSFLLNFSAFDDGAVSFHFINLLIYAATGFLIYLVVRAYFENYLIAYLSAIFFLILPIHSEVVANITGRSELLSMFFSLLVLLEFSRAKVNYWRSGLWGLLAVGSKETAIAIIPIVFLAVLIKERDATASLLVNFKKFAKEIFGKYFWPISALIIGSLAYFVLRFFSLGTDHFLGVKTTMVENPLVFADPFARAATAFKVLWMYVHKTFLPFNLCSDYSYNQIEIIRNFYNGEMLAGVFVFVLAVFAFLFFLNKKPLIALSAGIFIFGILPTSNLFFATGTIAGERLFYYPSLGVCFLLALIFSRLLILNSKILSRAVAVVLLLIFIFYGAVGFKRAGDWMTEENLFTRTAKCAPRSVLARSNLGAIYLLQGDYAKAKEELEISKNIKPIYSKGLNNLGLVYSHEGDMKKARELFLEAIKQDFPYPGAFENLAMLYVKEGKIEQARKWLKFVMREDLIDQLLKSVER